MGLKRLVEELAIRYTGRVDEDEVDRQLNVAHQSPNQSYSAFYDSINSIALRLKDQ